MTYVLDTNALAALMAGQSQVVDRLARESRANVAVPHPVLAEVVYAAIAAHAAASGATLVTANLRQMVRVPGLTVESWLTAG